MSIFGDITPAFPVPNPTCAQFCSDLQFQTHPMSPFLAPPTDTIEVPSWVWSPFIRPEGLVRKRGIVDEVYLSSLTRAESNKALLEAPMSG